MFNYAQAQLYEEEYEQALLALRRSAKLDPAHGDVKEKLHNTEAYINRVQECVSRKASI